MGEQNSVLKEWETEPHSQISWDDYESEWDDNEPNLDPINSAPDREHLPSLHNDKYRDTYNLLIHKYKGDVQRLNELRNQSVFLLTAMVFLFSFLLSSAFGIFGLNATSLDHFKQIFLSWGFFFILGYLVVLLLGSGVLILFEIYLKTTIGENYQWEYPGSKFLDECKNPSQDVFIDLREECGQLAQIILHNSKKNEELHEDLIISINILIICFALVFSLCMVFLAEEAAPDIPLFPLLIWAITLVCTLLATRHLFKIS